MPLSRPTSAPFQGGWGFQPCPGLLTPSHLGFIDTDQGRLGNNLQECHHLAEQISDGVTWPWMFRILPKVLSQLATGIFKAIFANWETEGVWLFLAHGAGNSRHSPGNNYVAGCLGRREISTVLFDL